MPNLASFRPGLFPIAELYMMLSRKWKPGPYLGQIWRHFEEKCDLNVTGSKIFNLKMAKHM
jgi:hypothetical protein